MKRNRPSQTKQSIVLNLLTPILFLSMLLCVSPSYGDSIESQTKKYPAINKKVTVEMTNASINEILYSVEQQSGIRFVSRHLDLGSSGKPKISMKNVSVKRVLHKILKDTPFTYEIRETGIVICQKKAPESRKMEISGKLLEENGEPLAGAVVVIVGTTRGVIADKNGEFKLKAEAGYRIEITYVGYIEKIIKLRKRRSVIEVRLKKDPLAMGPYDIKGPLHYLKTTEDSPVF